MNRQRWNQRLKRFLELLEKISSGLIVVLAMASGKLNLNAGNYKVSRGEEWYEWKYEIFFRAPKEVDEIERVVIC